MSNITYQIESILPDKLLLANQVLLTFAEINKLRKQGMNLKFLQAEQDVAEKIIARCDFYQWAVDFKPDRDFEQMVQKNGFNWALKAYKKRYVAQLLRQNKMDLKKTAKLLQWEIKEMKEQLIEMGFKWEQLVD